MCKSKIIIIVNRVYFLLLGCLVFFWSAGAARADAIKLTICVFGADDIIVQDNDKKDLNDAVGIIESEFQYVLTDSDNVNDKVSYDGRVIAKSVKNSAQITITDFKIKNQSSDDDEPIYGLFLLDYNFNKGPGYISSSFNGTRSGGKWEYDLFSMSTTASTFDSNPVLATWSEKYSNTGDNIVDSGKRHGKYETEGPGYLTVDLDGFIGKGETFTFPDSIDGTAHVIPEPATMLLLGSGLIGLAGARRKLKK